MGGKIFYRGLGNHLERVIAEEGMRRKKLGGESLFVSFAFFREGTDP